MNGDWETVHRRKIHRNIRRSWENNIVSFFVSNIPDGYGARELREVFNRFGNLVDVYMARKKDRSGTNFGFIRYVDVGDVVKFEESFGEICMGNRVLAVNVSRYQRRSEAGRENQKKTSNPKVNQLNEVPKTAWGHRGPKSFANVVMGGVSGFSNKPTSIKINTSQEIEKALAKTFLIGEVKDSEILKAIPNLLIDEGISFRKVFFYGGLYVLIGFEESSEAQGLLQNIECWNKWFKWIKMGDYAKEVNHQRAADVEIIGLPMQYRTAENITNILGDVGRVLRVDEDIWKSDSSACVGCILTGSKTMINKEMHVVDEDEKEFVIGIIERSSNLKPFDDEGAWGDNTVHGTKGMEDYHKNDDDEVKEDVDRDDISKSWNNNEWEEGEFRPNDVEDRMEANSQINDVIFPVEDILVEAINASNIPENNSVIEHSIIEESVVVPPCVKSAPEVQIPWAPMYTNGSCFTFGSTFKKRRKFSPTRRS